MSALLDANVLIALSVEDHVHHSAAHRWLAGRDSVATCPITQGSLLRELIRGGIPAASARRILAAIDDDQRHEFWPDDLSYLDVPLGGVIGHRQVTDTYLAALARRRSAALATFDKALASAQPDVAELIPVT